MNKYIFFIYCIFTFSISNAQQRVITTSTPFLMVAADARSAGMADIGIATSSDVFSQQWNPAKFAFATSEQGLSISYTPYLTDLVNDISLGQISYFNKINDRSAWATSLRYFGLGNIELRNDPYEQANVVSPNELALDGSYSLQISKTFSMAVAGRYIRSNLNFPTQNNDATSASSFAVDVAGFYQSEEKVYTHFNGIWRAGFNIQNLGPKINYDNVADKNTGYFLPANLKIGTGFEFIFDEDNKFTANLELNKLLVPTPQFESQNVNSEDNKLNEEYKNIGWVSGIFKSFGDAPNGFSEELKEITYAIGTEYAFKDSFMVRAGYFHESPDKGARNYFSMGAGFKYTSTRIDVSYLFSTSKIKNPLENTLRFSLTFNFGDNYGLN